MQLNFFGSVVVFMLYGEQPRKKVLEGKETEFRGGSFAAFGLTRAGVRKRKGSLYSPQPLSMEKKGRH